LAAKINTAAKQASNRAMGSSRVVALNWITGFMVLPFFFLAELDSAIAGLEEGKNLARKLLRLIQIGLATPTLAKISPIGQANSPQVRITDSSSRNGVNFSSARTISNAIGYAEVFQPVT
jgi:hypothetical protein